MSATDRFIQNLSELPPGTLAQIRTLTGQPLDRSLTGFDLFTGLWWPLRERNPRVPPREVSWLVTKLYAAAPIPHHRGDFRQLPTLLRRCEPRADLARKRFRLRFDAILNSSLAHIEPHLAWALRTIVDLPTAQLDWVQLTDDLSYWDRESQNPDQPIRSRWASLYLPYPTNSNPKD
jgi:CRISPR type I-E-associated protein CasB/Cse2